MIIKLGAENGPGIFNPSGRNKRFAMKLVKTAPINTTAPVISGVFETDAEFFCTTGTWTGSSPVFSYQWKADDEAITGAINPTYILTEDDLESEITCLVTAVNGAGSETQISNGLSIGD